MSWKSWIPYHGDARVRKKLRELDKQGIGIPVVIVLFLQKGLETFVASLGRASPLPLWLVYTLSGFGIFVVWVYDRQLQKKASEATEKAKEKAEEKTG